MINVSTIQSVYSGRPGCCCGCRGKHTYATAFADKAPDYDRRVSDRTVKLICNKINAAPKVQENGNHFFAEINDRWYIAYKAD